MKYKYSVEMGKAKGEKRRAEKQRRIEQCNELLQVIAGCGRNFFSHAGRIASFNLDTNGKIWFMDAYGQRIYTQYIGRWKGFSEGGTLRDLVRAMTTYIATGVFDGNHFGPWPSWYSAGDPWGYGQDMPVVRSKAVDLGLIE